MSNPWFFVCDLLPVLLFPSSPLPSPSPFLLLPFLFLWDRISLCTLGCPQTCNLPAPVSSFFLFDAGVFGHKFPFSSPLFWNSVSLTTTVQAGFKIVILLPAKCWDERCVSPCPAENYSVVAFTGLDVFCFYFTYLWVLNYWPLRNILLDFCTFESSFYNSQILYHCGQKIDLKWVKSPEMCPLPFGPTLLHSGEYFMYS